MANTTETKTVCKVFMDWDFDKAEDWCNEMAAEGWALEKPGRFIYHFKRCEPGEYTVRIQTHDIGDMDYLHLLEESGAEYLGTDCEFDFFRKKTDGEPFELFSDIDSRIVNLDHIGRGIFASGIINIIIGVVNTFLYSSEPVVWINLLNLLAAMPLMYGLGRVHGKKEALKKERQLHE